MTKVAYVGGSSAISVFGEEHRWQNVGLEVDGRTGGSCGGFVGSGRSGRRESERALRPDEGCTAA
jgi:hypothetical protein